VARHPSLQAIFVSERRERPLQVVRRNIDLPWEGMDWTALGTEEQEAKFREFVQNDRLDGYDLALGPLMRFALMRIGPEHHRFVWGSHHLLVDGWSSQLVLNEVFDVYDRLARGEAAPAGKSLVFRSYVEWLLKQDWADVEKFFRTHLSGMKAPTPMVVDRFSGSTGPTTREARTEEATLSAAGTSQLKAFARARKMTLNTVVQAAWGLLLNRYSSELGYDFWPLRAYRER